MCLGKAARRLALLLVPPFGLVDSTKHARTSRYVAFIHPMEFAAPLKMIGLIAHAEKADAGGVVREIVSELERNALPFLLHKNTAPLAGLTSDLDESSLAEHCELLVVVGGDGTILRVVQRIKCHLPIIFGINIGALGFLTCLGSSEIRRAVECIQRADYVLSRRALLRAVLTQTSGDASTLFALNDVVVSRGERSQLVQMRVTLGGIPLTDYNADGLVVATPTGSTAYSLSAGGPILMPDSGGFVITPICPHVLTNRSVVVSDSSVVEIQVAKPGQVAFVSVDAQSWFPMSGGDSLRLEKSDRFLPLAMLPERPFTEVLRRKLKWTGSNL
jgi:NAD+ kinase